MNIRLLAMHINYITSTSSVSPLTSSSYLSSFASSTPSLPGGVPNQQHLAQTHSLHSQLHGRLSGVNGLGTLPSDDEDIEEDDDGIDEAGDSGSSLNTSSSRDRKNLSDQLNGDKTGKTLDKNISSKYVRSAVPKVAPVTTTIPSRSNSDFRAVSTVC